MMIITVPITMKITTRMTIIIVILVITFLVPCNFDICFWGSCCWRLKDLPEIVSNMCLRYCVMLIGSSTDWAAA